MIIVSRCPYRISLLGGGSDLEWFVHEFGRGMTIGFSIQIYSRIALGYKEDKKKKGILNYSSREEYSDLNLISHPIIKQTLKRFSITDPIELASFGSDFSGAGLGSSSSFTVALIKALSLLNNKILSNEECAHLACEIEINDLNNPIGRQDQYLCSLGGVNILEFKKNDKIKIHENLEIKKEIANYAAGLFLIDTKIKRSASKKLYEIKKARDSSRNIEEILKIADEFIYKANKAKNYEIQELLESYLTRSWSFKKKMNGVMNNSLEDLEDLLSRNNFKVLKLLGAGGGGYFLVKYQGKDLTKSINILNKDDINPSPISIDYQGCTLKTI